MAARLKPTAFCRRRGTSSLSWADEQENQHRREKQAGRQEVELGFPEQGRGVFVLSSFEEMADQGGEQGAG
jgi:hypothetical protein